MNYGKQHPPKGHANVSSPGESAASEMLRKADIKRSQGNSGQAREICKKVIAEWPEYAEAWHHLGLLEFELGDPAAALQGLQHSIELDPGNSRYQANLGLFFYQYRRPAMAEAAFRAALELNPHEILALVQLGNLCFDSRRYEKAVKLFRQAIALKPDLPVAHYNLGSIFQDEGNLGQALSCYDKVMALAPSDGLKIKRATALPVIIASHDEIEETRKNYAGNIEKLRGLPLEVKNPVLEVGQTGFYLAYHGLNDRPLQESLAALYEKVVPGINYVSRHCLDYTAVGDKAKIRVGFISEFFRAQTVGMVLAGIINRIDRDKFHITIFHFPKPDDDEVTAYLKSGADTWVELTSDLEKARSDIEQQRLDILVYTDIGMAAATYFLAFSRLAPVQCVTWGHPVTTGIRNMDYYISCEDFEPEDADDHYSEKLVCLKSPPTYYHRPDFPVEAGSRQDYGLTDEDTIYLCVQNLFKFHPDFDEIVGRILMDDKKGRLVLMHGSQKRWGELLMERLASSIPDVVDRIVLLPRQSFSRYLKLLMLSDVGLDTLHFGGGSTTYQCLAAGLPVVTMPGKFMRGRFTFACYQRMKVMDCVAGDKEDYVRIAVRLGTDSAWRKDVSGRIASASDILYEDSSAVSEFEKFFVSVVRNGGVELSR